MSRPDPRTPVALLLALGLVAGCSHHGPDRGVPMAAPSVGPAPVVPPTGPVPLAPPAGPDPGTRSPEPGSTTPPGSGGTTAGEDTTHRGTTHPSRPPGRPVPPIDAGRVAWLQGTVSRGGTGPCYGVIATDGVGYALYSTKGFRLTVGNRVRLRITPGATPVRCGDGRPGVLEVLLLGG